MLNKEYVPHDLPIYPIRYFYNRSASDRDFILKRMRAIPEDKQQEASDKYEKLFTSSGRKEANTFIHNLAVKYRDAKNGKCKA